MKSSHARIEGIFIAETAGSPMQPVASALAVADRGLERDRYFDDRGTWPVTDRVRGGNHVTLMESEAITAIAAELGVVVNPAETRRNLLTSGVRLSDLEGKTFRVGEALLRGLRPCDPCGYLERLSGKPMKTLMQQRGGLRADVIRGGSISVGSEIEIEVAAGVEASES